MDSRRSFCLVVAALVLGSCGAGAPASPATTSAAPTMRPADPTASAFPSPGESTPEPSPGTAPTLVPPAPTSQPTEAPAQTGQPSPPVTMELGLAAMVIADTLRVRSQPRISDDSVMYEPLLANGTKFTVVDGPVPASGYWWYRVELPPGILEGGITQGWVAGGDRDGTPWIVNMGID